MRLLNGLGREYAVEDIPSLFGFAIMEVSKRGLLLAKGVVESRFF
jgi:hypothetical protein